MCVCDTYTRMKSDTGMIRKQLEPFTCDQPRLSGADISPEQLLRRARHFCSLERLHSRPRELPTQAWKASWDVKAYFIS